MKLWRVWLRHRRADVWDAVRVAAETPAQAQGIALREIKHRYSGERPDGLDLMPKEWETTSVEEIPSLVSS